MDRHLNMLTNLLTTMLNVMVEWREDEKKWREDEKEWREDMNREIEAWMDNSKSKEQKEEEQNRQSVELNELKNKAQYLTPSAYTFGDMSTFEKREQIEKERKKIYYQRLKELVTKRLLDNYNVICCCGKHVRINTIKIHDLCYK